MNRYSLLATFLSEMNRSVQPETVTQTNPTIYLSLILREYLKNMNGEFEDNKIIFTYKVNHQNQ